MTNLLTRPTPSRQDAPFRGQGRWGLIDLPLRAAFSPSHPLARRDVPLAQARAFHSSLHLFQGSGQGRPLLRASNEHRFTVRVLRARRAPGCSLPILLRPRVARAQKIIRRHPLPLFQHAVSFSWSCGQQTTYRVAASWRCRISGRSRGSFHVA